MKIKSKFRRAIIRGEIDKKLVNHNIPVLYKSDPASKVVKTEMSKADK